MEAAVNGEEVKLEEEGEEEMGNDEERVEKGGEEIEGDGDGDGGGVDKLHEEGFEEDEENVFLEASMESNTCGLLRPSPTRSVTMNSKHS